MDKRTAFVLALVCMSIGAAVASNDVTPQDREGSNGASLAASIYPNHARKMLGGLAARLMYGRSQGHAATRQVQERGTAAASTASVQDSGPDSWQWWGGGNDWNDNIWQNDPWDRWDRWNSWSAWGDSWSRRRA